jgi:hypothetical protein
MSYGGLPNNYNPWPDDPEKKEMKHKESEYYKELKLTWRRGYWTWERIHKLGRASMDGGVRMMCEKLAAKVSKGIPLLENDIRCLERLEKKPIIKDEQYSNEHDIRDESNYLGFDGGGEG